MTTDTARLIAYHDTVCSPNCGDDISTYPTPPDDWTPGTSDEYVPNEQDLEVAWIESEASANDINAASAEFDRFLARVRQEAKAEGWTEGAQAQADTYGGQIDTGPNPYEETP
ncbi:hypothetical protein M3F63_07130 [Brachybacterium muris]|uniref:hypothetical protein n=1 Tax=Brachybacterium muris TaxID=219301 RepID=UPI00223AA7C2|nr:hypothetical protein [Brachybacterium muris]MCT2177441.1 hypothetical protein [Brachybacterium muris]